MPKDSSLQCFSSCTCIWTAGYSLLSVPLSLGSNAPKRKRKKKNKAEGLFFSSMNYNPTACGEYDEKLRESSKKLLASQTLELIVFHVFFFLFRNSSRSLLCVEKKLDELTVLSQCVATSQKIGRHRNTWIFHLSSSFHSRNFILSLFSKKVSCLPENLPDFSNVTILQYHFDWTGLNCSSGTFQSPRRESRVSRRRRRRGGGK